MVSNFSNDGNYFAQISSDGKLKLWNTATNKFEQEFTPDFHLTSPCVCLQFIGPVSKASKNVSPRKKFKRRNSMADFSSIFIGLGTTSGLLLVYSITKAALNFSIDSKTNQTISCLSWQDGVEVYSGIEQNVVVWDIKEKTIKCKWKTGNEKISSILINPTGTMLLTASKSIKLWDLKTQDLLTSFTGHSSNVIHLCFIYPSQNSGYFISCAKADRIITCWSLDGTKNAVANFQTEDIVNQLNVYVNSEGVTEVAAVTQSGGCHVFIHTLNGKSNKPLKPKTTLQVVSDLKEKGSIMPIPIKGAFITDNNQLTIAHGNAVHLIFESVVFNSYEKIQCIIRRDPCKEKQEEGHVTKTRKPIVDDGVHYLTPYTHNKVSKYQAEGTTDVPMEKRLENLTLNKLDSSAKVPLGNNMAQLLLQGIHSKDKNILRTVMSKKDENVINNTIKRLPMTVIVPLVEELTNLIQGKTLLCQTGVLWLKSILQTHAGILVSNPELADVLSPVMSIIESRLSLQTPLNRLQGRLDLLVTQLSVSNVSDNADTESPLMYNDQESSDSEMDGIETGFPSESENEWLEEDSEVEDAKEDEHVDDDIADELSS